MSAKIANGGITLEWTIPQYEDLKSFKIYRSEQESFGYSLIATVEKEKNSYIDKEVQNGHNYWYRITAVNNKGAENSMTNTSGVNITTQTVLLINSGDEYTLSREVALTILSNSARKMIVSNNCNFFGTDWEDYASSKNWMLETGVGQKTVYLKVKYDSTESDVISASITPKEMNPMITIVANAPPYTSSRAIQLSLTFEGSNAKMKISEDSIFGGISWKNFSTTTSFMLSNGEGKKIVYAMFKNDFEIESAVVCDTILPEPISPVIVINDGREYCSDRDIQLFLQATASENNLQMKISEDSSFTGIDWQIYSETRDFQLSSGEGLKEVYVKFINDFEIESERANDSMILDTTPPTIVLTVNPDSGITNETEFMFNPAGSSDNLAPVVDLQMHFDFDNDGSYDTEWEKLSAISHLYDIGGDKTVKIQLRDRAEWITDTTVNIFVNTRPQASFSTTLDEYNYKKIRFNSSESSDYEDSVNLEYRWDFNGDENWDTEWIMQDTISYVYPLDGEYNVKLLVSDQNNLSNEISKQIIVASSLTDIDGNVYKVVKIGTQLWMAENLKVTHYRNGDTIPIVTDDAQWDTLSNGAYCAYNNDTDNIETYGLLYNVFATDDNRFLAPDGWHIPSGLDWQIIIDYLGGNEIAGGKMKMDGTSLWISPNSGATNESGFSALPAGGRSKSGTFVGMGFAAWFWVAPMDNSRELSYNNSKCNFRGQDQWQGLSVRCVKD